MIQIDQPSNNKSELSQKLLSILVILAIIGLCYLFITPKNNSSELQSDYEELQDDYNKLQEKYSDSKSNYEELKNKYDDLRESYDALLDKYEYETGTIWEW
jgi:Tfp pilus assembly protein PilO